MPDDEIPETMDSATVTPTTAEVFRRSDCCFARVEEHIEDVPDAPDGADWKSIEFICNSCGNRCSPYTNPLLARFAAEREGKEVEDDA